MQFLSPLVSLLLTTLLVVSPLAAQSVTPVPTAPEAVSTTSLQLKVLDGNAGTPGLMTAEVTDLTGAPVPNAAVVFRFADDEASGEFADGTKAAVVYTDQAGRSRVEGIRWAATQGRVPVRVTAAKGTAHAGLLVEHVVTAAAPAAVTPPAPVAQPIVMAPTPAPAAPVAAAKTPGVVIEHRAPAKRMAVPAFVEDSDSPDANVPLRSSFRSYSDSGDAPGISIASSGRASSGHSKKKWIISLAVGAGAGVALAMMRHGSTSGSSASGITIGSPTVSVGHP